MATCRACSAAISDYVIRCPRCGRGVNDEHPGMPTVVSIPDLEATRLVAGGASAASRVYEGSDVSEIVIVPDSPPSSGRPRVLRSRPMPVDGRRRPGAPDLPATSKAVARLRIASIGCAAVGGLLLFVGSFVPVFSISLAVEGQPVVQGVQDVGWVPWAWSVALLGLTAAASALAGDLTRTRALWSGMAGLLVVYALSTVLRSTHMPKVGAWIWAAGGLVLILASIVSAVESAVADPPAQTRLARRRMLMKMFAVAAALALCGALFTITPVVGLLVAPLVVVGLVGVLWVIDGSR